MTHPDNDFYGHAAVLAGYCGLSPSKVLSAQIQHGWSISTGLPDRIRLPSKLRRLVWSEMNLKACVDKGVRRVEAIGAPFTYIPGDIDPDRAMPDSTIVYPFHGWERSDAVGSHGELIRAIEAQESGNVTIALYWNEFRTEGIRRRYEASGFRVISHGDRSDPDFILRQRSELLNHRRVVSNNVSTAIWYGGHLALQMQVYGPAFSVHSAEVARRWQRYQQERWPQLDEGIGGRDGQALAGAELGTRHRRSPDDLRRLIGWRRDGNHLVARTRIHAELRLRTIAAHTSSRLGLRPNPEASWLAILPAQDN